MTRLPNCVSLFVLLPLILETEQRYRHNALDGHEAKRGEMMDWSEHTHLTVPSARQRRDKNHGNHVAHYDRKRPSTNVGARSMKMLPTGSLIRLSLIRAFILVIERVRPVISIIGHCRLSVCLRHVQLMICNTPCRQHIAMTAPPVI